MPYRVRSLGPERLRQAFSLIQAVHPGLSLEAWRRYARPRLDRPGGPGAAARRGILCLENQRGCILALYAFRVEPDLSQGCVLRCEYLAAVDLLNPRQALTALIEAICHGRVRRAAPRSASRRRTARKRWSPSWPRAASPEIGSTTLSP